MKSEMEGFDSSNSDYLNRHFPLCMSKKDLLTNIQQNEGFIRKNSRNFLVNELETIILFQIRCNRGNGQNGYSQLYYSPEEIVNDNFGDNAPQMREALTKRGVICPKKVVQRKQKLIEVLRSEMKEHIRSTFITIVQFVLLRMKKVIDSTQSITKQFLEVVESGHTVSSEEEAWLYNAC